MTVEEHKHNDEAAIKRAIEGYVEALRARDLDGVMSIHARSGLGAGRLAERQSGARPQALAMGIWSTV
jgi:hypothetical protein